MAKSRISGAELKLGRVNPLAATCAARATRASRSLRAPARRISNGDASQPLSKSGARFRAAAARTRMTASTCALRSPANAEPFMTSI